MSGKEHGWHEDKAREWRNRITNQRRQRVQQPSRTTEHAGAIVEGWADYLDMLDDMPEPEGERKSRKTYTSERPKEAPTMTHHHIPRGDITMTASVATVPTDKRPKIRQPWRTDVTIQPQTLAPDTPALSAEDHELLAHTPEPMSGRKARPIQTLIPAQDLNDVLDERRLIRHGA